MHVEKEMSNEWLLILKYICTHNINYVPCKQPDIATKNVNKSLIK